jgi:subtilisin-like proprotein convertase family protein
MFKHIQRGLIRVVLRRVSTLLIISVVLPTGFLLGQCFAPGNISVDSVGTQAVKISWQDANTNPSWEIELRTGIFPFNGIPTHFPSANPYILDNLSPGTEYRLRIRAVCQNGSKSNWIFIPFFFTTASFNPTACQTFFKINDDNCPNPNIFHILVDQAPGQSLGQDVILDYLDLIVRHTFLADLHISLESPSGLEVALFAEHGQSRDHLGNPLDPNCTQVCRFSDTDCQAINPLEHNADFINTFYPDESLGLLYDGSDPNGIWKLKICDDAKADTGSLRFLQLHFTPIACAVISDLQLERIEDDEAEISWLAQGNCDSVVVEYGPAGFTPGTNELPGLSGQLLILDCNSASNATISNLQSNQTYDLYIRSYCQVQSWSENSCALNFTTSCVHPGGEVHSESFDLMSHCGDVCLCEGDFPLDGFWQNNTDDDMDWLVKKGPGATLLKTGPLDDMTGGGHYLFIQTLSPACQGGSRAILHSECIRVEENPEESCHFTFNYHMWGETMGNLKVEATSDGGLTWASLWSESGNQGIAWHKATVGLGAYRGDTIQLRLMAESGLGRTSQIALDDLKLFGIGLLGAPDRIFYVDQDGDGFGNPDMFGLFCQTTPPEGFVTNALDCNDFNANIHPEADEIACNGVDENCNGLSDDIDIEVVSLPVQWICPGDSLLITVSEPPVGQYFWYENPSGGNPIHVGNIFAGGPLFDEATFYIQDSSLANGCNSIRKPVFVKLFAKPELVLGDYESVCMNDSVDLETLPFQDLAFSGATFTFHSASPAIQMNELPKTMQVISNPITFLLKATTPNGCFQEIEVPIEMKELPEVILLQDDTLQICTGQALFLQAASGGGAPPYSFAWSHGFNQANAPILAGNIPGLYFYGVSVVDNQGCRDFAVQTIEVKASLPGLSYQVTNVTSCGGTNGSITLSPFNNDPYHYTWSGPVSGNMSNQNGTVNLLGLMQGSYTITITNATTGCPFTLGPVLVNGPGPVLQNINRLHETCPGLNDGRILLDVIGGGAQYAWSNGAQSKDVSNLSPGVYSVTISGGGCSFVVSDLEINDGEDIIVGGLITKPSCSNTNDAVIELTLSGGLAPFEYVWNTGSNQKDLTSVGPGTYNVTISDVNGCSVVSDLFVVEDVMPISISANMNNPSCQGYANGGISLQVGGGQPPYQFFWNDGGTTRDRNNIPAGDYRVTVVDAVGCIKVTELFTLIEPDVLTGVWGTTKDETCSGAKDGTLEIIISGGTSPYQYKWSEGGSGNSAVGLNSGIYTATITDSRGCQFEMPVNYLQISNPLVLGIDSIRNPTCDYLSNGAIYPSVSGGSGTYEYLWSNGSDAGSMLNLTSGIYGLTVTDSLGCKGLLPGLVLWESSPLNVNHVGSWFPLCSAQSMGNIEISVMGNAPFTYLWSNGSTTEDLKNINPGYYHVTVEDNAGCQSVLDSIPAINAPPLFYVNYFHKNDIRCAGESNGFVEVEVIGGTPPFQYNWSNGKEKDKIESEDGIYDLTAGEYSVTITDNRGCVATFGPVVINTPDPLVLNIPVDEIRNVRCFDAMDGGISLNIGGGTMPYSSFWMKDSVFYTTTTSPQNLVPGNYSVVVYDQNGCIKTIPQPIEIIGPPSLFTWQEINHIGKSCDGLQPQYLEVKMKGGVPEYVYLWDEGSNSNSIQISETGNYCITVTDQFNCQRDTCLEVEFYAGIDVEVITFNECDSFSSIEANVVGGLPPFTYYWSNQEQQSVVENLPTGFYGLTITDALDCYFIEDSIQVGWPALRMDTIYSLPATPGKNDGKAIVKLQGGTPPYTIQWDVNTLSQVTDTAFNLWPGNYCVFVTDYYNCFFESCIEVLSTTSTTLDAPFMAWSASPNPFSDDLYINHIPMDIHYVELMDAMGNTFVRKTVEGESMIINTRLLPTGIYILKLFDNQYQLLDHKILVRN